MHGSTLQSLNLEASGGELLIEFDPRGVPGVGWARCSLAPADGGPPRFLGADGPDLNFEVDCSSVVHGPWD